MICFAPLTMNALISQSLIVMVTVFVALMALDRTPSALVTKLSLVVNLHTLKQRNLVALI